MNYINNYYIGDSINDFVYEINITSSNTTCYLPLDAGYNYNFICDYGDGTATGEVTSYDDPQIIHTYSNIGTYHVRIHGLCETFIVGDGEYKSLITKIIQWGDIGLKKVNFNGCNNLTSLSDSITNGLKNVLSFKDFCKSCNNLEYIPNNIFKYAINATDFSYCFFYCTKLTTLPNDIFKYNTNMTTIRSGFHLCYNLETIPDYLLRYNTKCYNYIDTFSEDYKLTLKSNIFYENGEQNTRFMSMSIYEYLAFTNTFSLQYQTFSGVQGTAPDLWNCSYTAILEHTGTFNNHSLSSVSNYLSIPSSWK